MRLTVARMIRHVVEAEWHIKNALVYAAELEEEEIAQTLSTFLPLFDFLWSRFENKWLKKKNINSGRKERKTI